MQATPHNDFKPSSRAAKVVLDTQVVLDWLVFRDPGVSALVRAIEAGSVGWLASQSMRDELESVLDRGIAAAWPADRALISQTFDRFALVVEARLPPANAMRCSDPDDQMFIDLALQVGARWLITRDRALLRLARKARARGVTVLRPADWEASLESVV